MRLLPCDGKELRQRQKRADRDLRLQGRQLSANLDKLARGEVDVSTLGSVPEARGLQHNVAQMGPISFCVVCGCYAENVSRGLLDACLGKPASNSAMDKARRHKRKRLLEGKHPVTGQPLAGAEPGQLARLERWRNQDDVMAAPPTQQPRTAAPNASTASHSDLHVGHDRPGAAASAGISPGEDAHATIPAVGPVAAPPLPRGFS